MPSSDGVPVEVAGRPSMGEGRTPATRDGADGDTVGEGKAAVEGSDVRSVSESWEGAALERELELERTMLRLRKAMGEDGWWG
jgi:hypothetical protein